MTVVVHPYDDQFLTMFDMFLDTFLLNEYITDVVINIIYDTMRPCMRDDKVLLNILMKTLPLNTVATKSMIDTLKEEILMNLRE